MKKKISLKYIAEKAGVSVALVSYILNDKLTGRINKQTAARVKKLAASLNYRPNQIARSLKTDKTFTIGLIVSDISNPFSSQLARVIENEAEKHNYTVISGSSDENADRSAKLLNLFIDRQVDGIILAPVENTEIQVTDLLERKMPFVLIDRFFPDLKTNSISLDNYNASFAAVNHLIENGVERIGFIGYDQTLFNLKERERGYVAALKLHRIKYNKSLVKSLTYHGAAEEITFAIDQLVSGKKPVEGIFFASNLISSLGIKYINKLKIRVPGELALISFDETEAADLFYAPVTYIKQPISVMGKAALGLLLNALNKRTTISNLIFGGELIIRESSIKFPKPGMETTLRRGILK